MLFRFWGLCGRIRNTLRDTPCYPKTFGQNITALMIRHAHLYQYFHWGGLNGGGDDGEVF